MVMTLKIELAKQTDNLFFFMGEVHRLCSEHKSFIFGFKRGYKLYLETCKGLQKKAYACVAERESIEYIIATLNYAVALQSSLLLSLDNGVLCFEISSPHFINRLMAFADSLNVQYDIS